MFSCLGGRVVWPSRFELMLIGPQEEPRWDFCFIAEYPSVAAFVEMIGDPVYREAVKHRQAGGGGLAPDPACRAGGGQEFWRDTGVCVSNRRFMAGRTRPSQVFSRGPRTWCRGTGRAMIGGTLAL